MKIIFPGAWFLASVLCISGSAFAQDAYKFLRIEGQPVKWGAAEFGTGASLTYAILGADEIYSGVRNCPDTGSVEPLLARAEISLEEFEHEVAAALAHWERVADVRFRPVEDAASADILIAAQLRPRDLGYADVSRGEARSAGVGAIAKGLFCLHPELRRTPGSRLETEANAGDESHSLFDLEYTLAREFGHLLGLDHSGARGTLMSFSYDRNQRDLQRGDIAGMVVLYGPAQDIPSDNTSQTIAHAGKVPDIVPASALEASRSTEADVMGPAVRLLVAPETETASKPIAAPEDAETPVAAELSQTGL